MKLQQIQYALRVAEYKSFSKAANALSISQPTLTQQIGKLEEELGVTLFQRTTRSVIPTNAGLDFVTYGGKVLRATNDLIDVMSSYRHSEQGFLHIGIMPCVSLFQLTKVISDFSIANDELTVEVNQASSCELVLELLDRKMDVAFIDPQKLNLYMRRYLDCHLLKQEPICLAVPRDHRLASTRSVTFKDVQGESFLVHEYFESITDILRRLFLEQGLEYRVAGQYMQVEEMLQNVAAGRGLAFLPASLYEKTPSESTCLLPFSPSVYCNMALATAKERSPSLPLKGFVDYVTIRYREGGTI